MGKMPMPLKSDADIAIAVFVHAGEGVEHVEVLIEANGAPFLLLILQA
jgi:hypothetical protein